jgi:hypothetical protein
MELDLTDVGENEQATESLRKWCEAIGYRVKSNEEGGNFMLQGERRWILSVKASRTENHRIVATCIFRTNPEVMGRDEWLKFVNKINTDYNVCKFCLNDSDDFEVQYNLQFLEKLPPRMFRNFISYADGTLGIVLDRHRDVFGAALQ